MSEETNKIVTPGRSFLVKCQEPTTRWQLYLLIIAGLVMTALGAPFGENKSYNEQVNDLASFERVHGWVFMR